MLCGAAKKKKKKTLKSGLLILCVWSLVSHPGVESRPQQGKHQLLTTEFSPESMNFISIFTPVWWQPAPVFLPGEPQGREPGGLPSMGSHRAGHD